MVLLGWLSYSKIGSHSSTHRTQVSLYEAHGIPWLEYKSSRHGYPIVMNILEVASGAGEAALRVLATFALKTTLACQGYKFNGTFLHFADPPFCSSDPARESS